MCTLLYNNKYKLRNVQQCVQIEELPAVFCRNPSRRCRLHHQGLGSTTCRCTKILRLVAVCLSAFVQQNVLRQCFRTCADMRCERLLSSFVSQSVSLRVRHPSGQQQKRYDPYAPRCLVFACVCCCFWSYPIRTHKIRQRLREAILSWTRCCLFLLLHYSTNIITTTIIMSSLADIVPPGVVTGDNLLKLLTHAKDNGYAIPAFNCTR